eukprot:435820-Pelagomonas_calceolata.AAC.1
MFWGNMWVHLGLKITGYHFIKMPEVSVGKNNVHMLKISGLRSQMPSTPVLVLKTHGSAEHQLKMHSTAWHMPTQLHH